MKHLRPIISLWLFNIMDILLLPVLLLTLFEWPWPFVGPGSNAESECVPVEECGPLRWISLHRANATGSRVHAFFQSSLCAAQSEEGKAGVWVRCPKAQALTVGEDAKDFVIDEGRFSVSSFKGKPVESNSCAGTVTLALAHLSGSVEVIVLGSDPNLNVFKKSTFGKEAEIVYVENSGSCCWQTFVNERLRGRCQAIPLGFQGHLPHNAKAFKRVQCSAQPRNNAPPDVHSCH